MADEGQDPAAPQRPRLSHPGHAVAAIVLLLAGLGWYVYFNVATAYRLRHDNDFKHLYAGALLLREGVSPYDREALQDTRALLGMGGINPYVYLPFTGQVLMPLTLIPPRAASGVWFLLNHALLWAGLGLMLAAGWQSGDSRDGRVWLRMALAAAFTAGSFAFYRTLTAGQLNVVLFAGYALVFYFLARGRALPAGLAAAFVALFKIAPGVLVFYFLLARRWRALGAMAAGGVALLLVSALFAGFGTYLEFLPLAQQMGYGRSTWGDAMEFYRAPFNQSINSFLHHVLVDQPGSPIEPWLDAGPRVANALTVLCALGIFGTTLAAGWLVGSRRRPGLSVAPGGPSFPPAERALFGAFVMASLLLPSLMWDHYMTIAMAAWLILLHRRPPLPPWPAVAGLVLLGLGFAYPIAHGRAEYWSGAGLLMMSLRLWPALIVWATCLVLSARRAEAPAAAGG